MAQLNSLIVTGDSRFLNTINGDISGNAETATTAITAEMVSSAEGTANADRVIYFAWTGTDGDKKIAYDSNFMYNPSTDNLSIVKINGATVGNSPEFTDTQSDWNATTGKAAILNKPSIPAAQVNSDWNATSGVAKILNKPTIPAAQVNSDWSASSGVAQILNKPTTLSGYGITDAKIASGVITLGSNTITPLTSSSSLNAAKLTGTVPDGCYTNTWTAMVGATSSANGSVGYVNAVPPKDGYNTKFLRADGSWQTPAYPTVNNATFKIQLGGTDKKSFTANASSDVTANFVFTQNTPTVVTPKTVVISAYYTNGVLSFTREDSTTVTSGTAASLAIN